MFVLLLILFVSGWNDWLLFRLLLLLLLLAPKLTLIVVIFSFSMWCKLFLPLSSYIDLTVYPFILTVFLLLLIPSHFVYLAFLKLNWYYFILFRLYDYLLVLLLLLFQLDKLFLCVDTNENLFVAKNWFLLILFMLFDDSWWVNDGEYDCFRFIVYLLFVMVDFLY